MQWILTHSFAAKAIAVKRVTTNEGKKTAGVDKVLWSTDKTKYEAILSLKEIDTNRSYYEEYLLKKRMGNYDRLGYLQ